MTIFSPRMTPIKAFERKRLNLFMIQTGILWLKLGILADAELLPGFQG